MRRGAPVTVRRSPYCDIPDGTPGVIDCARFGGYGVRLTANFTVPGAVATRARLERVVWFEAAQLTPANKPQNDPHPRHE